MNKNTTNAAKPIECVQKGGDPAKTVVWACGSCKLARETEVAALECCAPWVCDECGKEVKSYCEECSRKKQSTRELERYKKAEKVLLSQYAGDWVCCDHCDEYYPDVDSLLDAHDDDENTPTWAWGTTEMKFSLDAEEVISNKLEREEFYEDAFESFSTAAIKELQEFLTTWSAKQDVKSYMVDNSLVVEFEALVEARKKERNG